MAILVAVFCHFLLSPNSGVSSYTVVSEGNNCMLPTTDSSGTTPVTIGDISSTQHFTYYPKSFFVLFKYSDVTVVALFLPLADSGATLVFSRHEI